jgi:translation initiation factor 1
MSERGNSRTVYSTDKGRVCSGCGWPANDCKCSSTIGRDEPVPDRIVAKLRMEKKGRGGKTVTVVYGLPRNAAFLKELTQDLKRTCGTGGVATDEGVELQGDLRERVREVLQKKGYVVKG